MGCLILDLRWKIGNETYCTAVSFPIYQPTLILYFSNIPMSENAIVAPTVPAPITATLEAEGVGIVEEATKAPQTWSRQQTRWGAVAVK